MTKSKKIISKRQDIVSTDYVKFVTQLKKKIRSAQFKAALAVNRELIRLYWDIGREVVERQEKDGWGSSVIDRVSRDIQNEFPGIEGFSKTNMGRMRAFYLAYSISPQAVGKLEDLPIFSIPWGHNIAIFEGVKSLDERLWYVNMVIQEGWSRNALVDSIKIKTYKRHGKAITNFQDRLPVQFMFKSVEVKDRSLVHEWLLQPHIAEWIHGVGLQNTLNGLEKFFQGQSNTTYWIAYDKNIPFSFLITSPEDNDATTLDLFICDLNYLGKGIAMPMIQEFLISQFPNVKRVLIDPEATNKRAIHVYQKAGFKIIGEFIASWHPVPHYQMELYMKDLLETKK